MKWIMAVPDNKKKKKKMNHGDLFPPQAKTEKHKENVAPFTELYLTQMAE